MTWPPMQMLTIGCNLCNLPCMCPLSARTPSHYFPWGVFHAAALSLRPWRQRRAIYVSKIKGYHISRACVFTSQRFPSQSLVTGCHRFRPPRKEYSGSKHSMFQPWLVSKSGRLIDADCSWGKLRRCVCVCSDVGGALAEDVRGCKGLWSAVWLGGPQVGISKPLQLRAKARHDRTLLAELPCMSPTK